jgi:hypothetical protein
LLNTSGTTLKVGSNEIPTPAATIRLALPVLFV